MRKQQSFHYLLRNHSRLRFVDPQIGTGTLKITGNNTYTGYTTVSGGSLLFSNSATPRNPVYLLKSTPSLSARLAESCHHSFGSQRRRHGEPGLPRAGGRGGRRQVTTTIQGELLVLEEGTSCKCTFKARKSGC